LRQSQQSSRFCPQARIGAQHILASGIRFIRGYFTYFGDFPFDHGS